ncbi:MAG: DUF342 domain-containing protein [Candidatus Latescibacteria bacterium]|nr:DUF342 domain-containing protein [Candidatus Latescibacterota bacterium]
MPNVDASVKFKVTDKNFKVVASYTPYYGEGNELTVDDVLRQLESLKVTHGIKHDIIKNMCESNRPLPSVIIAEGTKPQLGEKARIETLTEIKRESKVVEDKDGKIDFKNLGDISSAVVGQELYRKIPPTIGATGIDVYGNVIPGLPGKDLKLVTGYGTIVDENDPNLVRAKIAGEIQIIKGVLQISDIHYVKGDVNYESGNIKFNGNVKIDGAVMSGFKIEADGSIEIRGNVEDADVIAGNDVIIAGGCAGSGHGMIQAGRDVYVKFVENQTIKADRDIFINGDSYHANLVAGRSISAKGKKSVIVGGQAEAKISVSASQLGSVACTPTVIKVGIDPKFAERLRVIEEEIKNSKESFEKLEKSIVFLYKLKIDNKGQLPPEKDALLIKLETAKKTLPEKISTFEKLKEELLEEQKDIEKAFTMAHVGVYPKVKVYIGNQWITIDDNLGPSQFRIVDGDVVRLSK